MKFDDYVVSVSSTHTYKTPVMMNGEFQHLFAWDYAFVGTMTGVLYVDHSNSPIHEIKQDALGGTDTTDIAVWRAYDRLKTKAGVQIDSVTISAAVADVIMALKITTNAVRLRYVNATNTGTLTVKPSSRKA